MKKFYITRHSVKNKSNSFFQNQIFSSFLLTLLFFVGSFVSNGQITSNTITGTNPNIDNPYSSGQVSNSNITTTGIGRGTGITGTNTNNRYNATGWNSGAIDLNDYYEFTITPNSAYKINFTNLIYSSQASGTGPISFAVRSSVDSYATDIANTPVAGGTIDLSSSSFQNITASIKFRIYAWGASAAGGTFSINDFTFNGSVTCISGNTVTNTNTGELFCTIQAAIDDAQTLAGHILTVSAGTYDEAVTVNKSLIINGANAGTAGNAPRMPESIVDGNGTHDGFVVTANNVTIDGFKVTGVTGTYNAGVYASPTTSGLLLQNSVITDNIIGAYPSSNGSSIVKNNLFDANNRPGSAGGAGIYVEATNSLIVEGNEFKGHLNNSAAIFTGVAANAHQGLIFTKNYIHDNNNGNSMVYMNGVSNGVFSENTIIQSGTTAIKVAGGNAGISIINNILDGNTTSVKIENDAIGPNTGVEVHNNSLSNSAPSSLSINNLDVASVNGTCNWYGGVGATVAPKINGPVTFELFLTSGTDSSPSAGFQPAAGTCLGCGSGNTVTNTTTNEVFCTIQAAINDSDTADGHTITISDGTYNEDVNLIKSLTLDGESRDGTIIKGLYTVGGNATLNIATTAGSNSTIKDLTISRDYQDWYGSTKNYGVLLSGGVNNVTIDNIKVVDNRNGIYVENNGQLILTNSLIERNRTGLHLSNTVRGTVTNNIIRENQTHGVFYNLDDGTSDLTGFQMHDNSITGNWYSEILFRGANSLSAQANFECNWFGTNSPTVNTANTSEIGYTTLPPQQLMGTAPSPLSGQFRGNGAIYIDYTSWRTGETGNNSDPFVPVGMCNGTPVIIASATPTAINCPVTTGSIDVAFSGGTANYTIAWAGPANGSTPGIATSPYTITGLSAGAYTITVTDLNGTTATASSTILAMPVTNITQSISYGTIQSAITASNDGDIIEVCAGDYIETITIDKAITLKGANFGVPGVSVRGAESNILNSEVSITSAGLVILDGFKITRTDAVASNSVYIVGSSVASVLNNVFERNGSASGTVARALLMSAGTASKTITNNLFTGDISGGLFSGHKTWNNAIWLDGSAANVIISNNTISNSRSGFNNDDNNVDYSTISGNSFKNNGTHISLGSSVPANMNGQLTLGANDFINNPASTIINLSAVDPAFRFNITTSTLNGTSFSALSNALLFDTESRMAHKEVSASKKGKVTYVTDKQYVNNFMAPITKIDIIQNSIKYFDANETINLQEGTYPQKVVFDKNGIKLQGITATKTDFILDGTGLGTANGITLNNNITGSVIKNLTIQNYTGANGNANAGIYAIASNNGTVVDNVYIKNNPTASGIYGNGPVNGFSVTNSMVENNGAGARGIVIWNGFKQNITISNNTLTNNSCCGIELQDGTASNVKIEDNIINIGGGDNAIGLTGLRTNIGDNLIDGNTITGGGRFGIEIKNPDDNGTFITTVSNNAVTLSTQNSDVRDRAGIAVFRRDVLAGNPDAHPNIPNGVAVTANTVVGYQQTSTSEGFGIVIEGRNHTVTGNTLTSNDIGIQQQAGHLPFVSNNAGNGDQTNVADQYFGRGNTPETCGNTISGNIFNTNGVNTRNIGVGGGVITNTTQNTTFCSIQAAIDAPSTVNGDVISVPAGTFAENVTVSKSLTINGPNAAIDACAGTRVAEAIIVPATKDIVNNIIFTVTASDVNISGFTIDGDNTLLVSGFTSTNGADIDAAEGIGRNADNLSKLVVTNNIFKNLSYFGVDIDSPNGTVSLDNEVTNNKFEDLGTYDAASGINLWGGGVLIYNNQYTKVVNNCMTNVRIGVQTGNFYRASTGPLANNEISNNTIEARRRGIFHNLFYSAASAYTLSNNTITGKANAAETGKWDGILLASMNGIASTSTGNNIDGTAVSGILKTGINVWNDQTAPAITGGTILGVDYGINVNNFEGYPTAGSDAGNTSATIGGITITDATIAGIKVEDSALNTNNSTTSAEIKDNVAISGSPIGILVKGSDATANIHDNLSSITDNVDGIVVDAAIGVTITKNNISDNTGNGVLVQNAGSAVINLNNLTGNGTGVNNTTMSTIDAKANWWGATNGPGLVWSGSGDKVSTNVDFCNWLVAPATSTSTLTDATGTAFVTSLTYAGSPYCQNGPNASPTLVGSGGGTYSSTGGLNIDPSTGVIDVATSKASTYTVTYTVNASGCSPVSTTAIITITPEVTAPGSISGPGTACPGTTGLIYSVDPVANATSYTWTVPTGWTISSMDATTNSITVTAGGCGDLGNITVVANNLCGSSTASTLAVSSVDNTAPVTAANGTQTVECLVDAGLTFKVQPAMDACSGEIFGVLDSTVDSPASIDCEGTRVYTYKYTDACNNSSFWTYTFTIKHTTNPKEIGGPVANASMVQCAADAVAPTILPVVNDVCGNALTASAAMISNLFVLDYSNAITLSATEAANVWYTDRYAPSAFASQVVMGGDTRLEVKISAADGASSRPSNFNSSFYNTQGRAFNVGPNADYVETKLYIPADWATSNKRMAGFWGVALDAADAITAYPIFEFTSDGGVPRFRAFETGVGTFTDLGLPTGFQYNTWVTLKTTLLPTGEFLYSVGDKSFQTSSSSLANSVRFKSVILQGHNFNPAQPIDPTNTGVSYDIYWDDLKWNNKTYVAPTCEGIKNYRYDFVDCAGLTYSWNYTYEIKDTQAPSLTSTPFTQAMPTNSCKPTQMDAEATFAEADAKMGYTDNCNPNITVTKISTTFGANDTDCDWTITHTYTLTDECGNTSQNKTYQLKGGDDTAPTITLPAVFVSTMPPIVIDGNNNVNVSTPSSGCIVVLPFNKPTNSDNCSGTITAFATAKDKFNNNIFIVDQGSSYLGNFPLGQNTLTFVATDACGNSTSKTITVTVVDDVKPIKPTLPNIVACGAVTPPTTTDNCSQNIVGTTADPTSYFVEGVYTINWTFTDASGNTVSASQQVTVNGSGSISGSIVADVTPGNNTVDGAVQPTVAGFVSIINGTTILATVPVAGGTYSLPSVCNGTYKIVLHNTPAGSTTAQLPTGYNAFISEGLLGGTPDATPNGIASVTVSAGAVIYNNARVAANGDLSFGLNPSAALPVRLISFTGKSTENGNELTWKASSEANFSHYEVERSVDASSFKMIGKVAGSGNTTENLSYNFLDDLNANQGAGMVPGANSSVISHNSSLNYYRLKMIDLDGSSAYSKVIFIDNEIAKSVVGEFYPNPAFGTEVSINITSAKSNLWTITTYDLAGKVINTETRQLNKGENQLKFETKVKKAGVSIFRFESADGVQFRKIISQ